MDDKVLLSLSCKNYAPAENVCMTRQAVFSDECKCSIQIDMRKSRKCLEIPEDSGGS